MILSSNKMIPTFNVGSVVRHHGHGRGIIVGLNNRPKNAYLGKRSGMLVVASLMALTGMSATNLFYDGDRYPYTVLFEDGYKDYYAPTELELESAAGTLYRATAKSEKGEWVDFHFIGSLEHAESNVETIRLMGFECNDPILIPIQGV